jgi:ribosome-associated protein
MLKIENELNFEYVRASGPGGQNVNKVSTAVQLRFDVANSPSLKEEVKARLVRLAGKRMTVDRVLIIEAKSHRTQEQNREDAILRFRALVARARQIPKTRKQTKPTRASKEARLTVKKKRSTVKQSRQHRSWE